MWALFLTKEKEKVNMKAQVATLLTGDLLDSSVLQRNGVTLRFCAASVMRGPGVLVQLQEEATAPAWGVCMCTPIPAAGSQPWLHIQTTLWADRRSSPQHEYCLEVA